MAIQGAKPGLWQQDTYHEALKMGRDGVDVETWRGRVWRWAKPATTGEALRLDQASKKECWRCCIRRYVQTPSLMTVHVV